MNMSWMLMPLTKSLLPFPYSLLPLPNRLRQGLPCIRPCFITNPIHFCKYKKVLITLANFLIRQTAMMHTALMITNELRVFETVSIVHANSKPPLTSVL